MATADRICCPRYAARMASTGDEPPGVGGSLRSRAALSTIATAVQGLGRLLYSVLIGHLGSRELLGQTNTSLSLSVLTASRDVEHSQAVVLQQRLTAALAHPAPPKPSNHPAPKTGAR